MAEQVGRILPADRKKKPLLLPGAWPLKGNKKWMM
jgi:hypothetical protein